MAKPKVPYLQYEILEYYFLKPKGSLGNYIGFKEDGNIVKNAIKKLTEKGLLTKSRTLTKLGVDLVKPQAKSRYEFPNYEGLTLSGCSPKQTTLIPMESLEENGNKNEKVFRWYKYLEDFPHDFIQSTIERFKVGKKYYILDPFAGSGTTLIKAKLEGYKSIGLDINPVMVFISKNKLNWSINVKILEKEIKKLIKEFKSAKKSTKQEAIKETGLANMPKREINQWLSPVKQWEVGYMLNLIDKATINKEIKELLLFITSTSALSSSYVAFCPGTTFYPFREKDNFLNEFVKLSYWVLTDLKNSKIQENKKVVSEIFLGSLKDKNILKKYNNKIDLIITSPPYPNDLEYTRQTRLELYLLGYVKNMRDVQMLKKEMVKGSTKLIYKEDKTPSRVKNLKSVNSVVNKLRYRLKDKNWGFDYPKMIEQYFADMWVCLENLYNNLISGGACVLVVGDQTFKEVVMPVAKILEEIGGNVGFKKTKIELHRQRRSTTHEILIPEENLILIK